MRKSHAFQIRFDGDTRLKLKVLAEREQVSASEMIRMLIDREYTLSVGGSTDDRESLLELASPSPEAKESEP